MVLIEKVITVQVEGCVWCHKIHGTAREASHAMSMEVEGSKLEDWLCAEHRTTYYELVFLVTGILFGDDENLVNAAIEDKKFKPPTHEETVVLRQLGAAIHEARKQDTIAPPPASSAAATPSAPAAKPKAPKAPEAPKAQENSDAEVPMEEFEWWKCDICDAVMGKQSRSPHASAKHHVALNNIPWSIAYSGKRPVIPAAPEDYIEKIPGSWRNDPRALQCSLCDKKIQGSARLSHSRKHDDAEDLVYMQLFPLHSGYGKTLPIAPGVPTPPKQKQTAGRESSPEGAQPRKTAADLAVEAVVSAPAPPIVPAPRVEPPGVTEAHLAALRDTISTAEFSDGKVKPGPKKKPGPPTVLCPVCEEEILFKKRHPHFKENHQFMAERDMADDPDAPAKYSGIGVTAYGWRKADYDGVSPVWQWGSVKPETVYTCRQCQDEFPSEQSRQMHYESFAKDSRRVHRTGPPNPVTVSKASWVTEDEIAAARHRGTLEGYPSATPTGIEPYSPVTGGSDEPPF